MTDKLILDPLKDFVAALSDAALGCGASLKGTCSALDYEEPVNQPQPKPSTSFGPPPGIRSGDKCPAGFEDYVPPPGACGQCFYGKWVGTMCTPNYSK